MEINSHEIRFSACLFPGKLAELTNRIKDADIITLVCPTTGDLDSIPSWSDAIEHATRIMEGKEVGDLIGHFYEAGHGEGSDNQTALANLLAAGAKATDIRIISK